MKALFFVFACFLSVSLCVRSGPFGTDQEEFDRFVKDFGRDYNSVGERAYRFAVFVENIRLIRLWNSDPFRTFSLGITRFADMTNEEYRLFFTTMMYPFPATSNTKQDPKDYKDLPKAVDWRKKGAVTDIKDQGFCGSCWAFSSIASIEGCHFQSTGELVSLSEQNLVDCSWDQGNCGCGGGFMTWAFNYVIENKGIESEKDYPYEGMDVKCSFNTKKVAATILGYKNVTSGDEKDLQAKLAERVVSVGIDASLPSFQLYSHGVYDDPACSPVFLDHGVTAVGYDTDNNNNDYYIIKNSWSRDWGNDGYLWLARNKNNTCGVATFATYVWC